MARAERAPEQLTLVGGAIVIVAVVIQTWAAPPAERDEEPALPAPR